VAEQPGGADERMAGERQLDRRRVDPQLAARAVVDEHGLGEAQLRSDGLPLGRGHGGAVEHDAERVAARSVGADEDAQRVQGGRRHGAEHRRVMSASDRSTSSAPAAASA
jgi:hypothetical protein